MEVAQVDFNSSSASRDFARSLKQTGFAVIKNHPIDYKLVTDVFKEWEAFFHSDYKMNYVYKNETQDGLFPMNISETAVGYSIKDIKEFYHYYPWGQYPPLDGTETAGAIRASAHTDINLITVLVAASQSGLQVMDSQGNWLEVPVDPGMLAINIGDMLQEASDGFYKSTKHQVVNPTGDNRHKSRYSIPLFLHARPDVVLSNRYTAGSFLHERLMQLGIKK